MSRDHEVLLIAATQRELNGADGFVCGVGPVAAAISTTRELAYRSQLPSAVIHIGVAGCHQNQLGVDIGSIVLGRRAVYCDTKSAWVEQVAAPDKQLVEALERAIPEATLVDIGMSADVGGTTQQQQKQLQSKTNSHGEAVSDQSIVVEAMEGFSVLAACAEFGVPAVELRVVSNEVGEADRALWRIPEAIEILSSLLPRVIGVAEAIRYA